MNADAVLSRRGGNMPPRLARSLVVIAAIAILIGSAVVANYYFYIQRDKERALVHLKEVWVGMLNYHAQLGCYPPPTVRGLDRKVIQGWRGMLVPFYGSGTPFFDTAMSWDSPQNAEMRNSFLPAYCSRDRGGTDLETRVVGIVGEGFFFDSNRSECVNEATVAKPETTICAVAVVNSGIEWAEPRDWDFVEFTERFQRQDVGEIPDGFYALFLDGSIRLVPYTTNIETVKRMLTLADD